MPRGALSGSRRVRGQKKVFWGRGECFSAQMGKYMHYMQSMMQIGIAYMHIHAIPKHTCS